MESETVEAASVPVTAPEPSASTTPTETPVQPAAGTPVEDTTPPTLAKHAEELGNRERDASGRYAPQPKHRSRRNAAGPEDVPRIQELTAKRKAAEDELEKSRARIAELEARVNQPPAQSTPARAESVPAVAQKPAPARQDALETTIGDFSEPEPTIDQFASEADPYQAHMRALGRWDRRKEQFEHDQKQAEQQATQAVKQKVDAHYARQASFERAHPDVQAVLSAAPTDTFTPLLNAAIYDSDKSWEFVYYLAQHPDTFYELQLHTLGKDVDDVGIATTQRFLERRVQTVPTGSVVPPLAPSPPVPKPPNPVRTGPMKSADEPPADVHSVADHQKAWGVRRR